MRGRLVGVSVPPGYPITGKPQKINHTEISIGYKADWPIRSGFLLTLITYITPLSLSMLATWAQYLSQYDSDAGELSVFCQSYFNKTLIGQAGSIGRKARQEVGVE